MNCKVYPDEVAKSMLNCSTSQQMLKCIGKNTLKMTGNLMTEFNDKEKKSFSRDRNFLSSVCFDGTEILPFFENVIESKANWKFVYISNTNFATTSDMVKFVKTFESTAEHLEVHQVTILNMDESEVDFNMKKLKSLSISGCDTDTCLGILRNASSLESLTLGELDFTADLYVIAESLNRCKKLKKLNASPSWFNVFFDNNASELTFQLEDLMVATDMTYDAESIEVFFSAQQKFFKYIQTQKHTLKKLKLSGMFIIGVIKLAFRMTRLEELSLPYLSVFAWPILDFNVNSTIEILNITSVDIRDEYFIKVLLKTVPNVKKLKMQTINRQLAKFMAKKLQRLERVSVIQIYDYSVHDILPAVLWE